MSDEIKALVERLVEPWESTDEPVAKKINRRLKAMNEAAAALTAQAEEIERLRAALEWYSNPEVYKTSPHGLAFDNRDLSYHALAALRERDDGR